MSSRPGILVTHKVDQPSLPAPNSHAPYITAEVRVHWPLGTRQDNAQHALLMAYLQASDAIQQKYAAEAKALLTAASSVVQQVGAHERVQPGRDDLD
jgi:hypothetical protein